MRKQIAAPHLSKLRDRPGDVTQLLRGHHGGQELEHTIEQLNNGARLLGGQATQAPLSSVMEKPTTELTADPILNILNKGLAAKVQVLRASGDQPLDCSRNLRNKTIGGWSQTVHTHFKKQLSKGA